LSGIIAALVDAGLSTAVGVLVGYWLAGRSRNDQAERAMRLALHALSLAEQALRLNHTPEEHD
jgi:argininosuccinate lyase